MYKAKNNTYESISFDKPPEYYRKLKRNLLNKARLRIFVMCALFVTYPALICMSFIGLHCGNGAKNSDLTMVLLSMTPFILYFVPKVVYSKLRLP
ncbi:MAG: hypothetical protein AAFV93_24040, partial [Chloroflexota bacterium]